MTPSRAALALLALWLGLGVLASLSAAAEPLWLAAGIGLAGAAALDAARSWHPPPLEVERHVPAALSTGVWTRVRVTLRNPSRRPLRIDLFDHHPPRVRAESLPQRLRAPAQTGAECFYRIRPELRGQHLFGPIELRVGSRFGLFERRVLAGTPQRVRAYPNFRAIAGYEILAAENRTGALGVRRRPRRGEGLEFHELREYRAGDSLRQIDWKATARLRRPISRDYQDQRDQQIVFLLDCGRRMHGRDGERSHFDAALDAVLLTAYVALRQGDAFGLVTFSGERRRLAPRKGLGQLNALLNSVYDLETGPRPADYAAAARDLAALVRKRALVVVLTNVRDEDGEELAACLKLLSRRHLVLLASLRESVLGDTLRQPVHELADALRLASVHLYLEQRAATLRQLRHQGALLLDSEPAELPIALVNRYLDVKAASIL